MIEEGDVSIEVSEVSSCFMILVYLVERRSIKTYRRMERGIRWILSAVRCDSISSDWGLLNIGLHCLEFITRPPKTRAHVRGAGVGQVSSRVAGSSVGSTLRITCDGLSPQSSSYVITVLAGTCRLRRVGTTFEDVKEKILCCILIRHESPRVSKRRDRRLVQGMLFRCVVAGTGRPQLAVLRRRLSIVDYATCWRLAAS